jgi:hypothetical protein
MPGQDEDDGRADPQSADYGMAEPAAGTNDTHPTHDTRP